LHTIIRVYPGIAGQSGRFAVHRAELEQLMGAAPGLVSFQLIETAEGVAAVTVCEDRAASDEASRRWVRWTDDRLPDLAAREPLVVEGHGIAETSVHGRPPPARAGAGDGRLAPRP